MERRGGAVSLFHRRDVPLRVVSGESDAEARDGLWRRNSQLTGRTTFVHVQITHFTISIF